MTIPDDEADATMIGTKACPMCAERIQPAATVCKHCRYNYATRSIGGASKTVNGFAIASMVLAILWMYWVGSILAIIFGHIALNQIKASDGRQPGREIAITGLVLGYLGIVAAVLMIVAIVIFSQSEFMTNETYTRV